MRAGYLWLSRLIALGVVLQAAFIAWGTFEIVHDAEEGGAYTEESGHTLGQELHAVFGERVIPLLALVMLILALFARIPRGVPFAAAVLGLVVLQYLLALVSVPVPWLGLLHAVNAFALAGVAGLAGRQVNRATAAAPAPAA